VGGQIHIVSLIMRDSIEDIIIARLIANLSEKRIRKSK